VSTRAPYNFVPLADRVVTVDWADRISHDVPFSDGVSGTIEIEIEAVTHLAAGWRRDASDGASVTRMLRLNDGRLAIAGSAVRGAVRSAMEIVTFARLAAVDRDRYMSYRDLTPKAGRKYREQFTESSRGDIRIRSLAGWLRPHPDDADVWIIEPCECARVEHEEIRAWARSMPSAPRPNPAALETALRGEGAGGRVAQAKYDAWGDAPLGVRFDPEPEGAHPIRQGEFRLWFSRAAAIGRGGKTGTLVFTGQPGRQKHREFIFWSEAADGDVEAIEVPPEVRTAFLHAHSADAGERHGGGYVPNDSWERWYAKVRRGGDWKVPVFYLLDSDGSLRAVGLAQLFRLPYRNSIGASIDRSAPNHRLDSPGTDLPTAIFGEARSSGADSGLAARARFSRFVSEPAATDAHEGVLSSPRPSFFPNYIEQEPAGDDAGRAANGRYSDFDDNRARIRGWKRYPVRKEARVDDASASDRMRSSWESARPGTRFVGRLRLHNVREIELGALLWTLTFGDLEGKSGRCHSMGHAKPFGFGAVRFRIVGPGDLRRADGKAVDLARAMSVFEAFMSDPATGVRDWNTSHQVREFLAMSDPANADRLDLTYMRLGQGAGGDEFRNARSNGDILPRYTELVARGPEIPRADPRPPRGGGPNRGPARGRPDDRRRR
jgi:CRISPR-associated protein (TIGR03986 family)